MGRQGTKWAVGIVAVALAVVIAWSWLRSGSPGVSEREYATQLLAEYLESTFKPKSVLVISNPFTQVSGRPAQVYAFEKAAMAGLQRGFGKTTELKVAWPALKPEVLADPASVPVDPRSATPLSFLVTEDAFDQAISEHPGTDLVVSLIGLPVKLNAMQAWNKSGSPRFALLLPDWRIIGDANAIQSAYKSGKLLAAVVANPTAAKPGTDAAGASVKDRYLLVSSNNVAETVIAFPEIFGLE